MCECECGKKLLTRTDGLLSGHSKSCGCWKIDRVTVASTKHGQSTNPAYNPWRAMIDRCTNPDSTNWKNYGARGVKLSPELLDFNTFINHIGPRPSNQHSIGRIDNNGDYLIGNIRWETMVEQSNNTRANRIIDVGGVFDTVTNHAFKFGIHPSIVRDRLDLGWSPFDAVTKPISMKHIHIGKRRLAEDYQHFKSRKPEPASEPTPAPQ